MTDLIDREDAYKVLTEYYHQRTDIQHEALREALSRVPPARVGRWRVVVIPLTYIGEAKAIHCSECDCLALAPTPYCPNCGARMEI